MLNLSKPVKVAIAIAAVLVLAASSCESGSAGSSQDDESDRRQDSYDALTSSQAAETMNYSPTRETINGWINTWDEPDKLSFIYIQDMNGDYSYYILSGLPVSYCAALTPTYEVIRRGDNSSGSMIEVPAPAMDGAYYSGTECNSYYGFDATTGQYMEWTVGIGQNYHLYEEPMPHLPGLDEAQPRGNTTIDDIDAETEDE